MAKTATAVSDDAAAVAAKVVLPGDNDIEEIFNDAASDAGEGSSFIVNINELYIDKANNSRSIESPDYSPESIASLAAQIKTTNGLLQPIVITDLDESNEETNFKKYLPVAGYRRIMALTLLAQETGNKHWVTHIPARKASISNHAAFSIAQLLENLGRKDLTPIEAAGLMQRVITESRNKVTQQNLAAMTGLSTATVSRYLTILKLPEAVKELISERKLTFQNASLLISSDYKIDDTMYLTLAKIGCRYSSEAFKDLLDKRFATKTEDDKKTSSKSGKFIKATVLDTIYIPYLKEQISKLEEAAGEDEDGNPVTAEKLYTTADLQKARLDTIQTLTGQDSTAFAKEVAPFKRKIEEEQEALKKQEEAKKGKEKFIHLCVKRTKTLLNMPLVDDKRPYPGLGAALVKVGQELQAMPQSEIDKLDWKPDIAGDLQGLLQEIGVAYKASVRKAAEDKARRANAKKEAEEKATKEKQESKGKKK